jgi:hypothetical protein
VANFIKNAAIVLGVLVVSTGIFFLVSADNQLKDNVLDRSLKLLGNQLISMIPERAEQEKLKDKWAEFSKKAQSGELPQENVERVAVGILNASNHEGELSSQDAETMLNIAMAGNMSFDSEWESQDNSWSFSAPKVARAKEESDRHGQRTWADFGEDLEAACQVNERIKETCVDEQKRAVLVKSFRYECDDGIKISADMEMKDKLKTEFAELDHEFKLMDGKRMLNWNRNLAMRLDTEKGDLQLHLDSLKVILRSRNIKMDQRYLGIFQHTKQIDALRTLEKLHHLQAVSPEYIKKLVHDSLGKVEVKVESH